VWIVGGPSEKKRNSPGDVCPQGQQKMKQQKCPGDECLLGLSPCHLAFPLLPISFDMAGYAGGLDGAGVGVPPLFPCCSSSSCPHCCLPLVILIHGAPCKQLLAVVGVGAGSPLSSAVEEIPKKISNKNMKRELKKVTFFACPVVIPSLPSFHCHCTLIVVIPSLLCPPCCCHALIIVPCCCCSLIVCSPCHPFLLVPLLSLHCCPFIVVVPSLSFPIIIPSSFVPVRGHCGVS
jgi:hypothetical protein